MRDSSMNEEYLQKVQKIAEVKYQLDEDIIEAFYSEIEECFNAGFTPRRTVEVIAEQVFSA